MFPRWQTEARDRLTDRQLSIEILFRVCDVASAVTRAVNLTELCGLTVPWEKTDKERERDTEREREWSQYLADYCFANRKYSLSCAVAAAATFYVASRCAVRRTQMTITINVNGKESENRQSQNRFNCLFNAIALKNKNANWHAHKLTRAINKQRHKHTQIQAHPCIHCLCIFNTLESVKLTGTFVRQLEAPKLYYEDNNTTHFLLFAIFGQLQWGNAFTCTQFTFFQHFDWICIIPTQSPRGMHSIYTQTAAHDFFFLQSLYVSTCFVFWHQFFKLLK